MKRLFCVLALVAGGVAAAVPQAEIDAAIARGVKYLLAQQASDGSFSDPHMPALTGLPLWALVKGGEGKGEAAKKAAQFVLGTQRPDGGFYLRERAVRKWPRAEPRDPRRAHLHRRQPVDGRRHDGRRLRL